MSDRWTLIQGEALTALRDLPTASVDALVTDPPYSSGGAFRGDRASASPSVKYVQSGTRLVGGDFSGDNRDQRSFAYWETLWLSEALRIVKPSGIAVVFTDWRQLPATTDALQAGGWVWRGIATWAKTTGRPVRGGFRNQAEFMVWGSSGPMPKDSETYLPGVITTGVARGDEKRHITAKPLDLMEVVVQVAPPGGVVLDPFAGSGSTGVAALRQGRRFLGIELSPEYAEVSRDRLAAEEGAAA